MSKKWAVRGKGKFLLNTYSEILNIAFSENSGQTLKQIDRLSHLVTIFIKI